MIATSATPSSAADETLVRAIGLRSAMLFVLGSEVQGVQEVQWVQMVLVHKVQAGSRFNRFRSFLDQNVLTLWNLNALNFLNAFEPERL